MILASVGFAVATVGCAGGPQPFPADLVFVNANIHTLSDDRGDAIAITGDRIQAIGSTRKIRASIGPHTRVIDLAGATVVPGLSDSHMHLSGVGFELLEFNLKGIESLAEFLAAVREQARLVPKGEWIVGRGWIESEWSPAVFPTRQDLDLVAPDHPVWLRRVDGHGAVANSRALRIAGIDKSTISPPGGEILVDDSGQPNGMILDAAQFLVERKIPRTTEAEVRRALIEGARQYVARGWTSVQIAGVYRDEAALIEELVASGEIPLRVYLSIYGPGEDADELLRSGPSGTEPHSRFTKSSIKVSYDGALGSGGAALLEPYSDDSGQPPHLGILKDHLDPAMKMMLAKALQVGVQVQVHAIGDRANRHILDLYESALTDVPPAERAVEEPRFRIEHAQILHPEDIGRFATLGVVPSMQASHAITDLHFADERLGEARLRGAYAWRSLVDTGVVIPGGTDAPVEAGDPRVEMYAAVARRDLKNRQGDHWHPEQSLDRIDALRMLTVWSAHAARQEEWRGTLAPGKAADLTIFGQDPLAVDVDQLPHLDVLWTVVGGRIVFDSTRPISPIAIKASDSTK